jgi:5,10-methylenetetrahydromethanopterin reductase
MASATLDRISGGRFLLGLGRSDKPVIQGRMGIPYGDSRAMLGEAAILIRSLLSGERISAAAGRFKLNGARLATTPLQQRLPIYLAAIGAKGLCLAGAVADGVLLNAYVPPAYVRYAVQEIRQAARDTGRDPQAIDIACMLVVRLTDDPDSLRPTLKQRLVRLLEEPHVGEILLEKGEFDPAILKPLRASVAKDGGKEAVGLISDEMVDAFYVIGPAARCKERIAAYRQAGVDLPLLLPRLEDYRKVAETLNQ